MNKNLLENNVNLNKLCFIKKTTILIEVERHWICVLHPGTWPMHQCSFPLLSFHRRNTFINEECPFRTAEEIEDAVNASVLMAGFGWLNGVATQLGKCCPFTRARVWAGFVYSSLFLFLTFAPLFPFHSTLFRCHHEHLDHFHLQSHWNSIQNEMVVTHVVMMGPVQLNLVELNI